MKCLFIFFTAIQLATLQRAEGKDGSRGLCPAQSSGSPPLHPRLSCRQRWKPSLFASSVTAFAEARLLGLVSCQDSSAAQEHRRINVTFLHVKDHWLFFTFYSVWSLFMETMAKQKERKRLFVWSGIQSAHWDVGRCKSPHVRLIQLLHGCAKTSGNHPRPVIRDDFWQHLPGGCFWSHSKLRQHVENTKKPSPCSNVANTRTVSDSAEGHCIAGNALQWLFVVRELPHAPVSLGCNMGTEVWWGLSDAWYLWVSWISTEHVQETELIWLRPSKSP